MPAGTTLQSAGLLKEPGLIVYASNITKEQAAPTKDHNVLLYFTHSHEAFEPITKAVDGKVSVSHQTENIMKVGDKLRGQLVMNGVEAEIIDFDNTKDMMNRGIPYHLSYKEIRPHVKKQLENQTYDLVIDLHRDSLKKDRTTVVHNGESYAKVAFVIGKEHAQYSKNKTNAEALKKEIDAIVPGMTRDIIVKGGVGVDGKYNQDIHPNIILIELGGVQNTEEELNRSVDVIARAITIGMENGTFTKEP